MATKTLKRTNKKLPIEVLFPINLSKNVRDPSGNTYNVEGLMADILMSGLKTRPLIHFKGGEFERIIQGNRRTMSIGKLNELYPHDERFKMVDVEVVDDLTDSELIMLMVDHGNTEPLHKHEVIRAVFKILDATPTTGRDVLVTSVQGLLNLHWPTTKTDTKEIQAHYTGTIQNIMAGWRLPRIGSDYYIGLIKSGKAVSYRKKDFRELVNIHESEMVQDTSGKVNKETPGPVFMKKWNEFIETEEASAADGKKPKGVASMSKTEIEAILSNSASMLLNGALKLVIRTFPESDKKILAYSVWLATMIEPRLTDADRAKYLEIMEAVTKAADLPAV